VCGEKDAVGGTLRKALVLGQGVAQRERRALSSSGGNHPKKEKEKKKSGSPPDSRGKDRSLSKGGDTRERNQSKGWSPFAKKAS